MRMPSWCSSWPWYSAAFTGKATKIRAAQAVKPCDFRRLFKPFIADVEVRVKLCAGVLRPYHAVHDDIGMYPLRQGFSACQLFGVRAAVHRGRLLRRTNLAGDGAVLAKARFEIAKYDAGKLLAVL